MDPLGDAFRRKIAEMTSVNGPQKELKKPDEIYVWEKYDSEFGEKGTIEENELYKVVQDNMPPTAGIKRTVDKFNKALESLKNFVGEKWSEDSYNAIINKLQEFFTTDAKKDIASSFENAFDNGLK